MILILLLLALCSLRRFVQPLLSTLVPLGLLLFGHGIVLPVITLALLSCSLRLLRLLRLSRFSLGDPLLLALLTLLFQVLVYVGLDVLAREVSPV